MKKINKIPTILGIIILLVGTFAGVFFLNMRTTFRIGADVASTPKDVRIGNITDNSVTVSWSTDKETTDFLTWGTSSTAISKVEKESESDQKFFNHSINLTGLKADTAYFFKINSDGTDYDNNNVPWQFTTGDELAIKTNLSPISGSVLTASGKPGDHALVYITINGYLISTLTSSAGNFVFQLAGVRTPDLKSYQEISESQTLLSISAQGGPGEIVTDSIFPQSSRPIPPLIFGQTYDHRNLPPNGDGQSPDVNLNLPANSTTESKFNVATGSSSTTSNSVILESLTDGEVVTSDKPQFFGKGPGGEEITITVHSEDPISETVVIPNSGSWSWSVPTNLAPGAHTITISWIDAKGITRNLTRNFEVQASELPAFVASSSATPTASGAATPKPTATAKPTASATAQPVPVTGDLTPTLLLSIMGIAVTLFSFAIWKTAEN